MRSQHAYTVHSIAKNAADFTIHTRGVEEVWVLNFVFFKKLIQPLIAAPFYWTFVRTNAIFITTRETREGWTLLTDETEVNGDSQRGQKRGFFSLLVRWACKCRYKRFLFFPGCSSGPSTKYFFPSHPLLQFLCPHRPARWAGSRAGSPVS